MKIFYIILLLTCGLTTFGQDISFSFANAEITSEGGQSYYEVDVLASSTSGFTLGSGLLYFNYNTAAFGSNIKLNGGVEYTYDAGDGYFLGTVIGAPPFQFGFYNSFISNDNTSARTAFSWQPAYTRECLGVDNITASAVPLFHIKILFQDPTEDPGFCFESGDVFDDQTFTALSSGTCEGTIASGSQIVNDTYDCSGAALSALPVEYLSFNAEAEGENALIEWETALEINSAHFEVEHSRDGQNFTYLGKVQAAGNSESEQEYKFWHERPGAGVHYYRLRQVDADGSFDYTQVRSIQFEDKVAQIFELYPNPASAYVNIKTDSEAYSIRIIDQTGRPVREVRNTPRLDITDLVPGVYWVQLTGAAGQVLQTEKLSVMR